MQLISCLPFAFLSNLLSFKNDRSHLPLPSFTHSSYSLCVSLTLTLLPFLVISRFGFSIFSHPNYCVLKTILTTVLVASRLGYEHQLALSAVPRRALCNDSCLVSVYSLGVTKECSYTFKHFVSSIVYINLLPACSWVFCRTSRLWISLLLLPVTAKV